VRERRLVFGEVAETYDRARPGYPPALFDALEEHAGLRGGDPICEIGAGSGKATRSLLARGWSVTAVEPSTPMADVLRRQCPRATVVPHGFDEFDIALDGESFAAVVAAQSWHWVTPDVRTRRAADVLRRRGWLAMWWNRPAGRDDDLKWALDAVYASAAAGMEPNSNNRIPAPGRESRRDNEMRADDEIDRSGLFDPVVVERFPWSTTYSTAEYVDLLSTYSDHRMLPPETLDALLAGVGKVLDAHGGGIDFGYVTHFMAARKRDGDRRG
jgi:hypothetical protein